MRTEYDLEMLQEMGFCNGIENYSRHLSGRDAGLEAVHACSISFPKDFLLVVDESHATIPQIGGMYEGDRSRKTVLVEYGFRLPSALDNRPLNFKEFMGMTNQITYVSATPAEFEIKNSVVGNTGYFPHKRERIGEAERCRLLLPGREGKAETSNESFQTFNVQRPTGAGKRSSAARISRRRNLMCIRRARHSWSSRSSGRPDCSIRRLR